MGDEIWEKQEIKQCHVGPCLYFRFYSDSEKVSPEERLGLPLVLWNDHLVARWDCQTEIKIPVDITWPPITSPLCTWVTNVLPTEQKWVMFIPIGKAICLLKVVILWYKTWLAVIFLKADFADTKELDIGNREICSKEMVFKRQPPEGQSSFHQCSL